MSHLDESHKKGIVIDAQYGQVTGRSNHFYIYLLTTLSCIGGFLFGYDTGVISGALILLKDDFDLDDVEQELIVGLAVAGALIASIFSGILTDLCGRRPIIMGSCILFTIGSITLAVAQDVLTLFIGRFIVGLGVGVSSGIFPIYVSECAPADIRGTLVTTINVAITFGQFFACCIDALLVHVHHGWRYMLGFGAFPAVLQLLGFLFLMPESPRWLIEHQMIDKATSVLQRLRDTFDVRNEIQDILLSLSDNGDSNTLDRINDHNSSLKNDKIESIHGSNYHDITTSNTFQTSSFNVINKLLQPTVRRALVLGCMLQAAQQFCGINTVMYYSATILTIAGFGDDLQICLWLTAVVSFFNFFGSCIGLFLVDSWGRRTLILFSLTGVTIFLSLLSISFYIAEIRSEKSSSMAISMLGNSCSSTYNYCFDCVQDTSCGFCTSISGDIGPGCIPSDDSNPRNSSQCSSESFFSSSCPSSSTYGWLIFAALCSYLLAFSPGMGCMPWTITSEIFPTSVRGVCNFITTTTNWSSNLIMSLTFLSISNAVTNQGAFGIYAGVGVCFLIYFYMKLPETKDLVLEDIQELFSTSDWRGRYYSPILSNQITHADQDSSSLIRLTSNLISSDDSHRHDKDSYFSSSLSRAELNSSLESHSTGSGSVNPNQGDRYFKSISSRTIRGKPIHGDNNKNHREDGTGANRSRASSSDQSHSSAVSSNIGDHISKSNLWKIFERKPSYQPLSYPISSSAPVNPMHHQTKDGSEGPNRSKKSNSATAGIISNSNQSNQKNDRSTRLQHFTDHENDNPVINDRRSHSSSSSAKGQASSYPSAEI